jgi:hypothetical protein
VKRMFVILAGLLAPTALVAPGAAAGSSATQEERIGDAVIVEMSGQSPPSGGSADVFVVRLTNDETCPGDTLHDGWSVQTFIVPASVPFSEITFGPDGPLGGAHQFALYMVTGDPAADVIVAPNDVASRPGRVALPTFSFNAFVPGLLPPGSYRFGVACTLPGGRTPARYWDGMIRIDSDPDDSPAQIRWTAAESSAPGSGSSSSSSSLPIVVIAVAVIAALAAALSWRSRSRSSTK